MTEPIADTWTDVLAALAAPDRLAAAFATPEAITRERAGCRLFTAMTSNPAEGHSARVYSSDPVSYPVSGRKPIVPNAWTRRVLDDKQPFVANTIAEIAAVFPDHALIESLGCGSCLNVPVIVAGQVRGTVNILAAAPSLTSSPSRAARTAAR